MRDRLLACGGAAAGIAVTGLIGALVVGPGAALPFIVAPIGASAVLVFAAPASPMAQPWAVIGGNTVATLTGVGVQLLVADPVVAAGVAVGAAIGVMSLLRCLHPPGGAAALTAVIGGSVITGAGPGLALVPVGLNSVVLVAVAWLFHRLSTRSYPHRAPRIEPVAAGTPVRLTAADVMVRETVSVGAHDSPRTARTLLVAHGARTLPVLGEGGAVVGTVGLRELAGPATSVAALATEPVVAYPNTSVTALSRALTDGRADAVVIVDDAGALQGVVTRTDLLIALSRLLPGADAEHTAEARGRDAA